MNDVLQQRLLDAGHRFHQRLWREQDLGLRQVEPSNVPHRRRFIRRDCLKFRKVFVQPGEIERLGHLARRHLEQVLIQGTFAATPNIDHKAA